MSKEPEFRLTVQEALERQEIPAREGIVEAALRIPPEGILEVLKASAGFDEIASKIPGLLDVPSWSEVTFFCVCSKGGSALWLDIWDADHFDGFTDMQHCVSDCRAWFSGDGYPFWGSAETKTGRVNCYFTVPSAGNYVCTAGLQSYPVGSNAMVECLIDNSSFGPLPFNGTIYQPHLCSLSAGGHQFRIRQKSGSFFFLSLVVHRV